MEKLIGGLKIGIAVVMIVATIFSVISLVGEGTSDGVFVTAIGGILVLGLVGFMLFYLFKTAIWNLKQEEYKWSLPLLIGMCFYFLGVCYFIYFPFSLDATGFIPSTLIFGILALFIVIKDLRTLLSKRK